MILDEKIAVMDTVDGFFTEEWLNNVEQVLSGKTPDYLVIQHMEPDHSASIPAFLKKYPKTTVISTAKGFQFMEQFFPEFFARQGLPAEQRIVAANDGPGAWTAQPAFCLCSHGALAGGYDDL